MRLLAYSTFVLLLVHVSVAQDDDGKNPPPSDDQAAQGDATFASQAGDAGLTADTEAQIKKKAKVSWKRVWQWLPPCDHHCSRSYYSAWRWYSCKYMRCVVNVGGCRQHRCGHPYCPWYNCGRCVPEYDYIKCSCYPWRTIRVVKRCKCNNYYRSNWFTSPLQAQSRLGEAPQEQAAPQPHEAIPSPEAGQT